jgi:hypothetical protein
MSVIRMCHETGCTTILSIYNPTTLCWEHRRLTRKITAELAGKHIQRDDEWLLKMQQLSLDDDVRVETWRPHMCSETFVEGMSRREFSDKDRAAYEDGSWLG